ncbi:MAG: hypothetical protein R3C56_39740 [Pirellulaceae bacterium]
MSALLDFTLSMVSLLIVLGTIRIGNDFLFSGFLWLAMATFVGTLVLAGVPGVRATHVWLDQVCRGLDRLRWELASSPSSTGLSRARWTAQLLAIGGATITYFLADRPLAEFVVAMGLVLLLSLALLCIRHFKQGHTAEAGAALASALPLAFAGLGLNRIPIPSESPLRHVDILHVTLIVAYP